MRLLRFTLLFCAFLGCLVQASARAQRPATEAPDPTRLDVERLPPEAIEVKRDMFAQGVFLQSYVGGRGFAGAVGRISQPGMLARVGLGYELTQWLVIGAACELSLHNGSAPPPPGPASFQLIDAIGEVRLQLPVSARATPWVAGEAGIGWVPGDFLQAYGVKNASQLGLNYGGSVGFDWHLLTRHMSLGLLAGARLYPNLSGLANEQTIGIHSAAYLKYVF